MNWTALGAMVGALGFLGGVAAVFVRFGRWQEQHVAMGARLEKVESGQTEILEAHSDLKGDLRELQGTIKGLSQVLERALKVLERREVA